MLQIGYSVIMNAIFCANESVVKYILEKSPQTTALDIKNIVNPDRSGHNSTGPITVKIPLECADDVGCAVLRRQ